MPAAKTFDPDSGEPFPLSRSKVELFLDCPRCFYLDRRLGVGRPAGFPFNLNSAVDELLKREFDRHRAESTAHPLMTKAGLNAVPHAHPQLDTWRANFKGVRTVHEPSGFTLSGAIDDLWRDLDSGEVIVVDYKSTSKSGEVGIDADWQISYKRQMEFYQWLLRRQGLSVARRGWFVYCNARRDLPAFDARLEFRISLIPYEGDDGWVEETLTAIRATLTAPAPPKAEAECDYCSYVSLAGSRGAPGISANIINRRSC
jgi:RecB family exonuclease